MKFGMSFANTGAAVAGPGAAELAVALESAGFDSVWTVEHVVVPAGYESAYPYSRSGKMAGGVEDFDLPDPLVWLAYVAAHTERLLLGTGIVVLPQRNPLILAKEAASLDVLSGGRVRLGIGAGWLAEEFAALGVPFEDRGARTDDYVRALRALWAEGPATYRGEFVSFERVHSLPRPVQRPIPIVVGGHSRRAARRAGELGDGFFPNHRDPEVVAGLVAHARESAERAGRDPAALEVTVGAAPDPARIEALAALGVDRVVVGNLGVDGVRIFGEQVIARFG
ncbi:MAG: LLM class F420-dependent oxidoreductase [Actinobacteria bacterium]|nr:LLM class F420-dependent oxidoreductase [Actinomycetota bacterium]